jgi:type II secretory pathway component PulJ
MRLADLLVATALTGVLLAGAFGTLDLGQRAWATAAARVEAQQAARAALAHLTADLRAAGFGLARGLSVAEPERVVLHVDEDGDGLSASRGESITWRLTGGVLRRDAGGGAQPVADDVSHFRLEYHDAGGAPTSVPEAVRRVAIVLALGPGAGTVVFRAEVRLRNL